jgi:glycosidase
MNEINVMGAAIRDSNIVHNSAKERYRFPLGAVQTGTTITLCISIHELRYQDAWLTVLRGGDLDEYEMNPEGDVLCARFQAPEEAIVLRYWFRLTLPDGSTVYYGAEMVSNSGIGKVYLNEPPSFQITVHTGTFHTPAWAKEAVLYQIFPDRFHCGDRSAVEEGVAYHRGLGRDLWLHDHWEEPVAWLPSETTGYYRPSDLFGGDLEGIRQSLPRLKALGITLLYLNPIFEAASNHRYNTADYLRVDPALGDEAAFRRLADEAASMGIHIILDGVFSHTGDDSIYFDKYGRYEGLGAYESPDSPFSNWYHFTCFPDQYTSWWGFDTLPEVDEFQQDWIDFIIEKDDSVLNTWLERGAAGFRLDVADELPDDTIERMRTVLKKKDPDSFLLGEVWEDATTKQSYNKDRRYALGQGLDSVMNYPFTNATVAFLKGHMNAYAYRRFLVSQSQNYPREMYYVLMNLLSSHDVARIRTLLGRDLNPGHMSREDQANCRLMEEEDLLGGLLTRIAVAIQFALPGIPSIYYGDEVGMTGLLDPFNRQPWHVRDDRLEGCYRQLAALRRSSRALQTGHAAFYSTNGNVLGVLRFVLGGQDAFGVPGEDEAVIMVCNPSPVSHRIVIDLRADKECMTEKQIEAMRSIYWEKAVPLSGFDPDSAPVIPIHGGLLEITLSPHEAMFYGLVWTP